MRSKAKPLFRPFGIPVRADLSLALVVLLITWIFWTRLYDAGESLIATEDDAGPGSDGGERELVPGAAHFGDDLGGGFGVIALAGQRGEMPTPAQTRRVLIAEDNPAMRRSLNEILAYEGYETVEAADGREALALLADHQIDILLVDLAMPSMSGIELLQQIDAPPPMVIIYSAFVLYTPEEVERDVGQKVFLCLRKPVPPAELVASVARAVDELDRR